MYLLQKFNKKLMILAVLCGILLANIPVSTVYASNTMKYGSWVQDTLQYDDTYGTADKPQDRFWEESGKLDETVGFGEFFISSIIEAFGWALDKVVNGDDRIKADIDTVIRGRLKNEVTTNFFSFELVDNNPWGIIGANMYNIARNAFFPFMIIVFIVMCIQWIIDSDKVKGMLDIKQGVQWTVVMVLWIYLFPMITDFVLYAKDAYMADMGDKLLDGEVLDLITFFYEYHAKTYSIVSALLYVGAVVGGIFFIQNYVFTAGTQTVLFGLMPFCCMLSIKFRKVFTNVAATFFPNLLIPVVDFSFLLLPLLYGEIIDTLYNGLSAPFLIQVIQLFLVWSIIPCRQAVFRAFGAMIGAGSAGGGFGGMIGTMAMMARSMSMGGRKSPSRGGNNGNKSSSTDDRNSARYHEQLNDTLQKDLRYNNGTSKAAQEKLEQMTSKQNSNNQDFEKGMSLGKDLDRDENVETISGTSEPDFDLPLQTEHRSFSEEGSPLSESGISDSVQSEPLSMHNANDDNLTDHVGVQAEKAGTIGEQHSIEESNNGARLDSNRNTEVSLPTREDNLSSLQSAQADYDAASATYQKEQSALNDARSQLRQNEQEIQSINREASSAPDGKVPVNGKYDYTPEQRVRVEQLQADNKRLNDNITSHEKSMNTANTQMSDASRRLHDRQRIEKSYAEFDKMSGGTGKLYSNVNDFHLDNSLKEAQKQFINHRNFDSKQFDGVLSNEEKAKYYRQRARVTDAQSAVSMVGGIATGAIATAAVAGSTFGGANAMVQSGMLGYTAGGYATNTAVQGVNKVIDHVPDATQVVSNGVKNMATSYNTDAGRTATGGSVAPLNNNVEASKNASYYKGQVLANEKAASLKLQEEAIRSGGAKTNGS